jgi:hypothetical protein
MDLVQGTAGSQQVLHCRYPVNRIAGTLRFWIMTEKRIPTLNMGTFFTETTYYKTSTLRVTSTYQIGGLNLKGPRPHPQGRGI